MIEVRRGGRRRIDRVLDPDFVQSLHSLALDDLRVRRDDAAQEETDLSYVRRLLHGRVDLVRAELRHRDGEPGTTVADLPVILGAGIIAAPNGAGRFQTVTPSRTGEYRRAAEALVGDPDLSDVTALSDDELETAVAAYEAEETSVSTRRQQVQTVMDTCNAEIGRRYREGHASIDGLLDARRTHPSPAPGPDPV